MTSLGPLGGFVCEIVSNTISTYVVPLVSEFAWQKIRPFCQTYWPVTYQNILVPAYRRFWDTVLRLLFTHDDDDDDDDDSFEVSASESPSRGSLTSVTPEAPPPNNVDDIIYVAVEDDESSKDAILWTLNHAVVNASTHVCLIHILPKTRYIQTPLGNKMLVSQVNEYVKIREIKKRTGFLQEFLDVCSASKIKVDIKLFESDMIAEELLGLIPRLNITKLVLGTPKSSRRELRQRKGNEIASKVFQNAPETCEVKIICEGEEVQVGSMFEPPLSHGSPDSPNASHTEENKRSNSFGRTCSKLKNILRKRSMNVACDVNNSGD